MKDIIYKQEFNIQGGDFINGGEASCKISTILKEIGIDPEVILRVAVASYEAEMNVVMYAQQGTIIFILTPVKLVLQIEDIGPGIEDINRAMVPGFSTATDEMREMGFGAGMGLPNIKENSDVLNIDSETGKGTKLEIIINLP
ncbi:MAG: anti-sigma regulatory factor [Desulfuromonas sp. SDB]|nr:MAG: anti-sigma regulatory factor [Desulfuromonas sp. SDB]